MAGRTESLGFSSFVYAGFAQLSKDAAVSAWLRSTDYDGFYRKLGRNNKNETCFLSVRRIVRRASAMSNFRAMIVCYG